MAVGSRHKNIFVVGLEPFNLRLLQAVRHADDYRFHALLDYGEIVAAPRFDMEALLDKARAILRAFPGPIDAIVGYWDFPTILMMPILRREFGLSGPTLESVLRCEHKYWSRIEQAKVVPKHVPRFALVDPFDDNAADRVDLAFPFWIKPIKAHSSLLGYLVRTTARTRTRAGRNPGRHPPLRRADGRHHGLRRSSARNRHHRRRQVHRRGDHFRGTPMHARRICVSR